MVHRTPFFFPLLYPSLLWRVPAVEKEIYLTFDDGPVHGPTEFVLESLATFGAKATFFCIGDNVRKHPEVFRRIILQGHAVGNHTFHHLNGWKHKANAYTADVRQCQQTMASQFGANGQVYISRLFRPPYGRISRQQIHVLKQEYTIVMWDVLSIDYNKHLSPEKCLKNTIQTTRPGSIVVFHDSVKAEKNMMYALPRVLDHFTEQGYTFKPLPG
ncbi:polysaccharide deacetylase family protein [Ohtaekwangia sp.]|uniref:polysaccharide deacetylase family protein n=1 Tax=Ohtaekwangia sp. TaxID=2066019 RepID=UPI002F947149